MGAYLGSFRAGVDGVLEHLYAAAGVEGAADATDQLLRLAREHRARDDDEGPGPPGYGFWLWIEDLGHGPYSTYHARPHMTSSISDTNPDIREGGRTVREPAQTDP